MDHVYSLNNRFFNTFQACGWCNYVKCHFILHFYKSLWVTKQEKSHFILLSGSDLFVHSCEQNQHCSHTYTSSLHTGKANLNLSAFVWVFSYFQAGHVLMYFIDFHAKKTFKLKCDSCMNSRLIISSLKAQNLKFCQSIYGYVRGWWCMFFFNMKNSEPAFKVLQSSNNT